MLQNKKSQSGFTLIEMMMVVAIIGVLATMAVPQFSAAQEAARTARVQADLRTIDVAIIMYENDIGSLPTQLSELTTAPSLNQQPYLKTTPVAPTGSVRVTPGGVEANANIVKGGVYGINTAGRATFGASEGTGYTVEEIR